MSNLFLSNSFDQELPTKGTWVLERFDQYLDTAIANKDITVIHRAIIEIKELAKVTGLTLAKLLYSVIFKVLLNVVFSVGP